MFFDQLFKALCCKALPYEKDIKKFVSLILFISFKFWVASTSVCPPDKKAIPGTSVGTFSFNHCKVFFAISLELTLFFESTPGKIMLGLSIVPLRLTLCNNNSL